MTSAKRLTTAVLVAAWMVAAVTFASAEEEEDAVWVEAAPTSMPASAVAEAVGLPAGWPAVLSAADVARYQRIFVVQRKADWKTADRLIAELDDRRLMGYVLAQRYLHPTGYRSRFEELRDWLTRYADHPDAQRLYKLALKRKPAKATAPRQPTSEL